MPTLFLVFLFALRAHAAVVEEPALEPSAGVPAWQEEYRARKDAADHEQPYAECREVASVPGAFLCLFPDDREMNEHLMRASVFAEGLSGITKGSVTRNDDARVQSMKLSVLGHDLNGPDLMAFYQATQRACEASRHDPEVCFTPREQELFERFVVPHAEGGRPFVLVAFGDESRASYRESASHEILHAQYFLSPEYREVTDRFWDEAVSAADKAGVRAHLGGLYDVNNELLMRNEFQAYILMANAEDFSLGGYVPKYRKRLTKKLAERGLHPVQLN